MPAPQSETREMSPTQREAALLSVSDKAGLVELAECLLHKCNLQLVASGGTAKLLKANNLPVTEINEFTGHSEMLGGRVKTLHPAVHAGILARDRGHPDWQELISAGYTPIKIVVCNLYPFQQTVAQDNCKLEDAVENIDIGGVTLLRAAAKNAARVTVLCDPSDYTPFIQAIVQTGVQALPQTFTQRMALKAFEHTAEYDGHISRYLKREFGGSGEQHFQLRYGMNPHQTPAELMSPPGNQMPIKILNGSPGYINLLDALNAWQLVRELKAEFNVSAAASFKHVSPAGAALGCVPLSEAEAVAFQVLDLHDLLKDSPLATAYARARGADRMSSFGDFIALSDECDEVTARVISREVSDGVIAPGFHPKALQMLAKKKNTNYVILEIDPSYEPDLTEERIVFGLRLRQRRNDAQIGAQLFTNIVSKSKTLPPSAVRDLCVASIALKYAQSNSVCFALNGQVIGLGAGQQSRIHCTRLAAHKAQTWWLRQHPRLASVLFKDTVKRAQQANAIEALLAADTDFDYEQVFDAPLPALFTKSEIDEWTKSLSEVALSSDAFFPFRDNIDTAAKFGVSFVASPGGSANDDSIVRACDEHSITLIHTALRLFTH